MRPKYYRRTTEVASAASVVVTSSSPVETLHVIWNKAQTMIRACNLVVDSPAFYLCAIRPYILFVFTELYLFFSTACIAASKHAVPKIVLNVIAVLNEITRIELTQVFNLCESVKICRNFSAGFCKDRCTES